jgi:hypothetical protein
MSEHTPGPWDYQNDTITSKHGDIARVHYQSSRDKRGWDDRPLIAAAPELLAALKDLMELYAIGQVVIEGEAEQGNDPVVQAAWAAINKAEGRGE